MADLRKIGRKSSKISQQGWSHVPHSTAPLPPRKVHLWHIFVALPAMNGPLPAELKFREKTGSLPFV